MLGIVEAGEQAMFVGAGGQRQIARRLPLVPKDMRARVKILHRQIARQEFAVAVGEIGAGGHYGRGMAAARRSQKRDMNKADSHQRESGNAQNRSDNNAPLKDRWCLAHILTYWGWVGRSRRLAR